MQPVTTAAVLPTHRSDRSLVERAQAGDAEAFESLLATRLEGLVRTAAAILGQEADARDAVQDACLATWRGLPRLRDPESFDAWLMRILRNACLTRLRRRRRVREIEIDDRSASATGADEPATVAEVEAILRAFDRLTIDQRTVLILHHLEHESVESIATRLGIPPGTVKSRLHTARRALESGLAGEAR